MIPIFSFRTARRDIGYPASMLSRLMMDALRILTGLAMVLMPLPALAWGPEGHEIVAAIAAVHLTDAARNQASSLLGGKTMIVLDADWADEIRTDRPDTASWHYVNIPLNAAGYDARRDCADDDCVVAQIARDARILADRKASTAERAEALRFLIHLVGDIHQPLHAADNGDKGGNTFVVYLRGRRTNLHRVWDEDVVQALGPDPMRVADQLDAALTPAQKFRDSGGTPVDWANESLAAGRTIYAPIHGPYLPDDYARRQNALVRDRLAKAGLRLAALLNRILR